MTGAENVRVLECDLASLFSDTTSNLYTCSLFSFVSSGDDDDEFVFFNASTAIPIFFSRMMIVEGLGMEKCQLTRRSGTLTP